MSAAFKHIGKALCVVLVILQIPGSAGTYPIEMTPAFFQKLHPLLYIPVALLFGVVVKVLLQNFNYMFDKKLDETDLSSQDIHERFGNA